MSVLRPSTASAWTSPPRPPSPPSGPPNSMNFSRRKLTAPLPPSPDRTYTLAWSRNFMGSPVCDARLQGKPLLARQAERFDLDLAAGADEKHGSLAGRPKSDLLEHASRRGIIQPAAACDEVEARHLEGVRKDGRSGFARQSSPPIRLAQPIA